MRLLAALSAGFLGFAGMGYLLGVPPRFERVRTRTTSRAQRRRQWLRQAGANVTPAQFYAGSAATGAITFVALWTVLDAWSVALVPAALAAAVPQAYYARRRRQHVAEVVQAWPDGLRDLAASIAARSTLHQALLALSRSGPAPLQRAFSGYPAQARVSGMVPALESIREELADPASDRVLEILILAKDRGSSALGRILEDLAAATAQDLRTNEEIETARQEPKLNMRITAAMPWVLLILLCVGDTPHRAFYASPAGLLVVALCATFTFGGILLVNRLSRDPVETRVFVSAERDDA